MHIAGSNAFTGTRDFFCWASRSTGLGRRRELQLEEWTEVFLRGSCREGQVRCWSSKKSETVDFEFLRFPLLSYFSICLKFSQSKALTSDLCLFSLGNTYRMEHELGIAGPLSASFPILFRHTNFNQHTIPIFQVNYFLKKCKCVSTKWGLWNWYFIEKGNIICFAV